MTERIFDPIDIVFIVLIGIYLLTLFVIILILVYGKKETPKITRYKVIEVIKKPKRRRKKIASTNSKMTLETQKPSKQHKPSDFKLGESVKVLTTLVTL